VIKHHAGRGIRIATQGKRPTKVIENIGSDIRKRAAIERKIKARGEEKCQ
jgi:hypothetical protein